MKNTAILDTQANRSAVMYETARGNRHVIVEVEGETILSIVLFPDGTYTEIVDQPLRPDPPARSTMIFGHSPDDAA